MRTLLFLLLIVFTSVSPTLAQNQKDKIEIGVTSTSLSLFHPDVPFDETHLGVGARATYNFNRSIAAEAEINFFPQKQFILNADGSAVQAQFGVKIGKRFDKFGLFGKLRPGLLSVGNVSSFSNLAFNINPERETFFTLDAGGVLELYPSKRTVVRFDAGDTALRHPARFVPLFAPAVVQPVRPAKFKHNFQFTAGVAFRLGDFPDAEPDVQTTSDAERTKRFEVGVQFSSLLVETPQPDPFLGGPFRRHAEPGFGARFGFNLTDNIAFEAEGNYFTRQQFGIQGGKMFQGQFGGKVGKRFDRWGLFGKAHPGFVGFSRVFEFPPGAQLPFSARTVRKLYPSVDLGAVVEFYISPRWMARFDIGDTLIRYDEIRVPGTPSFILQRKETRNNLQLSSGIAFRF